MSTTWPPNQDLNGVIREHAAWWSGDTAELTKVYSGPGRRTSGGLIQRFAKMFWSTPVMATGQAPAKLHVPAAADIAATSAMLLFGEPVRVSTPDDTPQPVTERVAAIIDALDLHSECLDAAEQCAALGGVFFRAYWDTDLADHPLLSIVSPDVAEPAFTGRRLTGVKFTWVLSAPARIGAPGQRVWRHTEHHTVGRIDHALYEGTATELGRLVPLTDHEVTAGLTVDAGSGLDTGLTRLTAVYVPNMRPQRRWRLHPIGANYGRADIDGAEGHLDALDRTHTSLMRDLRAGAARTIMPKHMYDSLGAGNGLAFDEDKEFFVGVTSGNADAEEITPVQHLIRVEEHVAIAAEMLRTIYTAAGYSPFTFGLTDGGAAVTATEVTARERKTMQTREKKTRYWTNALRDLIELLMEIDHVIFRGPGVVRPLVEFPAAVQPSLAEVAGSVTLLANAMAASVRTRVRMVHPDWTTEQIDAEVEAVLRENGLGPVESLDDIPA